MAGEEALLRQLPKGQWIGGTIPYFITPSGGGAVSQDKIFVTDITAVTASAVTSVYDQVGLGKVYTDAGAAGSVLSSCRRQALRTRLLLSMAPIIRILATVP